MDAYIDAEGTGHTTSLGANAGGSPLFSFSRVSSDVPQALARRIAAVGHVPESRLRYMAVLVDPISSRIRWLAYTNPGNHVEYFQASGATGPLFEYLTNGSTGLKQISG